MICSGLRNEHGISAGLRKAATYTALIDRGIDGFKNGPATLRSARSNWSDCAYALFDRSRGWAPSATEPQWPRINRMPAA